MFKSPPTQKVIRVIFAILFVVIGIKVITSFPAFSHTDDNVGVEVLAASPFLYTFNTKESLLEVGSMEESPSQYWWVDSGAFLDIDSGIGKTPQGSLPASDKWRIQYARSNPLDTDNGFHPQNIFRLISKGVWKNFSQEAYFMIEEDQLSGSPNRNESNGLLLFMRYVDEDNVYYAGLRVDGTAIIKKKIAGVYYTLDERPVFLADPYDRLTNPNLLPKKTWIGIRTEIKTITEDTVSIKVYVDVGKKGQWTLVSMALDEDKPTVPIISSSGYVGIRTDFMDVSFTDFRVEEFKLEK